MTEHSRNKEKNVQTILKYLRGH